MRCAIMRTVQVRCLGGNGHGNDGNAVRQSGGGVPCLVECAAFSQTHHAATIKFPHAGNFFN
jgi:hypothetical protein